MDKLKAPTLDEALEGQQKMSMEKLTQAVEAENLGFYRNAAEQLLEEHDAITLVSAALKLFTKEPDETPIRLTEESPMHSRRDRGGNRGGGDRNRGGGDRNRGGGQGGSKGNWSKRPSGKPGTGSGSRDASAKRQGFKRSSRKERV
jgi:ATP-dependent RNA helicase DeaD